MNVPLARLTPDVDREAEAEFYIPTGLLVGHPLVLFVRALSRCSGDFCASESPECTIALDG